MRIATLNAELSRDGPGILLRDITQGADPQINALSSVIVSVSPDVLVLQGVDYDLELLALVALRDQIAQNGLAYNHVFALRPNNGLSTGFDLDQDGRLGEPEDAQGYGAFSGQGGMAILSRFPIDESAAQDFSNLLWRDMPNAILPIINTGPFYSPEVLARLRLASFAHWVVPIDHPTGRLNLLSFHAAPPVFDGPEDRNGRRNHDQIMFWIHYLDGDFGMVPNERFVLIGDANQDPVDGEGRKSAIRALISDPRLQDLRPMRDAQQSAGVVRDGDPRLDTVAWPEPDPGHLRVSYVLPSRDWFVAKSGVHWPNEATPEGAIAQTASRHRMVWVDLEMSEGD